MNRIFSRILVTEPTDRAIATQQQRMNDSRPLLTLKRWLLIYLLCTVATLYALPRAALALPQQQAAPASDTTTADTQFQNARQLYEQSKWAEALPLFDEARKLYNAAEETAKEAEAWLYIGRTQGQLEATNNAAIAFQNSAALYKTLNDPAQQVTALQELGALLATAAQYDEAIAAYNQAIEAARTLEDDQPQRLLRAALREVRDQQALITYQAELEAAEAAGDQAAAATALHNLAALAQSKSNYTEALASFEKELAIQRDLADEQAIAKTLQAIGDINAALDEQEAAITAYQEAQTLWQKLGMKGSDAETLGSLGAVYVQQAAYDKARTAYEAALAIWQGADEQSEAALVLRELAKVYYQLEDYTAAEKAFNDELAGWQALGDEANLITAQRNLGRFYASRQQYEEALTQYNALIALAESKKDSALLAQSYADTATVYSGLKRYPEALTAYNQALTLWQEAAATAQIVTTVDAIAKVQVTLKAYDDALQSYTQLLKLAQAEGSNTPTAPIQEAMAKLYATTNQVDQAVASYQAALQAQEEPAAKLRIYSAIAELYRTNERYESAITNYQSALTLAQSLGDGDSQRSLLERLGASYQALDAYDEALASYQQAAELWRTVDTARYDRLITTIGRLERQAQANYLAAQTENGVYLPAEAATVKGEVDIIGIAQHPTFRKWQLDLLINGEEGNATFIRVGFSAAPTAKRLTTLDTTKYPNGTHKLRLRVVRGDLNYDEYFSTVTIAN